LYTQLRSYGAEVFHQLALQKEGRIEERHRMPDNVHMMAGVRAKDVASQKFWQITGKSAIHRARMRMCGQWTRNLVAQHFWA
jgi:putative transposase